VRGDARSFASARAAIESFRAESPGIGDQSLPAFAIAGADGRPVGPIRDGAAVVLFNFRGDRAIELSQAFENDAFPHFERGARPDALFAGMMQYDGDLRVPARFLVSPPAIERTLGEYLVHNGARQLAVSETQKFGHVTYFWNGNRSGYIDPASERYAEIESDLRPFEERPWMKAAEITDRVLDELAASRWDHVRLNYANGDMVGHTGVLDAAVLAVEAVDLQLGRLMPAIARLGGALLVTADHGNADEMLEVDPSSGERRPKTSHSLNRVPFHLYAPGTDLRLRSDLPRPGLGNVAATVLQLMGWTAPEDYLPSLITQRGS
jgi:2,3-bisphosphoglycerate-independent phosphoglycerate mutase